MKEISHHSLNDVTYRQIREDIMNMTLEPGMDVSVQKLSERYGVSRTPVREAVVRLQRSGLVEIYPQRKTVVATIDLRRVREEWFIRSSLESAVAEEFIYKCSELVADTMQELVNSQKKHMEKEHFRDFYFKDNRFHQLIFETAGEGLSWSTIEDVASHYNRIRLLYGKMRGGDPSEVEKHEKIIAATRSRDAESLRKAVIDHSNTLQEQVYCMLRQHPYFFQTHSIKTDQALS